VSRVLAYTAPSHGQLFPLVPVLDELRTRGHEVMLRTLAAAVGSMRTRGIGAAAIASEIEAIAMDDWRARTPPGAVARATAVLRRRAPLDAADLVRAIEKERPDALLIDVLAWGALCAAEASGLPWAAACPYPLPLRSRFGPPMGPGLRPARGRLGRFRDRTVRAVSGAALGPSALAGLNPLRESLGLAPFSDPDKILRTPPLLLYMSAEPFEYRRPDWPASVVMVGPCSWEPEGALPEELAGIEQPLVLVTTSTEFQDDGRLVEVAFRALADEHLHVVATVPAADRERLRPPANGTVLSFVPHGPILDRSVCAITHGGMGATQKALGRGVPVCVVPFGRDQYEVARRVEVNGAGTRLPSYLLRPAQLRRRVRAAIARREGATRMVASFAAAGGPAGAADAIEQRLLIGP
jgi:MGT family glycosyltransferase